MPFPKTDRFIYQNNPLEEVICQIRFPPILRITAQKPAVFQERIRSEYPLLHEKRQIPQMPVPEELQKLIQIDHKTAYDFKTENEDWTISLTDDFIAITTSNYTRWEVFREKFRKAYEALIDIYQPAPFTRLGLRYRDVIKRSALNIPVSEGWSRLLQPHIAGELALDDVSNAISEKFTNTLIALSDMGGAVRLRHGIGKDQDDEQVYIIDSDFFAEEKIQHQDVFKYLDHFNQNGRRLFRWCITDTLHDAMKPDELE